MTETRADWCFKDAVAGWYVINKRTNRAVAGPCDRKTAAMTEKASRDSRWPDTEDVLRVVFKGRLGVVDDA